jgi:hypothetical protein
MLSRLGVSARIADAGTATSGFDAGVPSLRIVISMIAGSLQKRAIGSIMVDRLSLREASDCQLLVTPSEATRDLDPGKSKPPRLR